MLRHREEYDLAEKDLLVARQLHPEHENAKLYLEITLLRRGTHRQERNMVNPAP